MPVNTCFFCGRESAVDPETLVWECPHCGGYKPPKSAQTRLPLVIQRLVFPPITDLTVVNYQVETNQGERTFSCTVYELLGTAAYVHDGGASAIWEWLKGKIAEAWEADYASVSAQIDDFRKRARVSF